MRIPPPAVIDCHFFIHAVTLTSDQRRAYSRPPDYDLILAFERGNFLWVWDPEILEEYERMVSILITQHKPGQPTIDKRRALQIIADIRRAGLLAPITEDSYKEAWHAVMHPARPLEEQDEDDVIYLAAGVTADAICVLSNDKSLKNLRPRHKGLEVVSSLEAFLASVRFERKPG